MESCGLSSLCHTGKQNGKKYLLIAIQLNYKELEYLAGALVKSGHSASLNPLNYPLMNNHLQMSSSPTGFPDNQSYVFLSQNSTFCFFLLTLLTHKLEGLPEYFGLLDLLDFQVSKVCHSFFNDNISVSFFAYMCWARFSRNQELCKANR